MENETIKETVQTDPIPAVEAIPAEETAVQTEAPAARPQPEPVAVTEEMLEKTKTTLATMLDYLGLDGTVKAESKPGKINLIVASNDAGRIIGRKGQSLESLQVLVNRMMQKGDEPFPKVYIDIDGYSSSSKRGEKRDRGGRNEKRNNRREFKEEGKSEFSGKDEQLRQQALDSAKEVRRWGEPVTLPPMNSHDRRIIHITLENEADLQTESNGDGNFKSVTISLKK
ncbi:MAG: KH domain-containing protein [Lentisphaeria bacterium]|nr:KH domain-containing protein [Lentisphaeria bacterium]MBR4884289.1 KH domain-containing protein [Lentisphaeria bacterium]